MNSIGIDIGGTKILIVLTDKNGKIKKSVQIPTTGDSPAVVLNRISAQLTPLDRKSHLPGFGKFGSIGIGIAGDVDSKNGILRFSPNLPKWKNIRLKKYFENKTGGTTVVENDANCAAYGSYVLDGKRKYKNFIMLTLGTGVGGGIIIDGNLYRGAAGTAGEIGHVTVNPNGPKCSCGNYGCLETYTGTKGIIRLWQAQKTTFHMKDIISPPSYSPKRRIFDSQEGGGITPVIIAELARRNNKKAQMVFNEFSEYLAIGVSGIINIFNPDMISFSGGVSNSWDIFKKVFLRELRKRSFSTPFRHVKIIKSNNYKNLGAIGAALLSLEKKGDTFIR